MESILVPKTVHVYVDLMVTWDCPKCRKENTFTGYMNIGPKQVSCKFCGERVEFSISLPNL